MTGTHNIEKITFDANHIFLSIDGKEIKIDLEKISSRLKTANEIQRNIFTISPSGYGIHWPLIDEDLAVDAILKVTND